MHIFFALVNVLVLGGCDSTTKIIGKLNEIEYESANIYYKSNFLICRIPELNSHKASLLCERCSEEEGKVISNVHCIIKTVTNV